MINYTEKTRGQAKNLGDLQLNLSLPFRVNRSFHDGSGNVNSKVTEVVEISWKQPPEPTCYSPEDCKDWPHSTCNAAKDGKKRCHCAPNFRWDVSNLNCTQG